MSWQQLLAAGRLIVKTKAPYFGAAVNGLAPREAPGLGTVAVTNKGVMMVDPVWLVENTAEEVAGLLVHEVMHVILRHCDRMMKAARDPKLSNDADDLSINPSVLEMGFQLPKKYPPLMPEQFGFPNGLTSDEYYARLKRMPKGPGGGGGSKGKGQGKGKGGAGGQGDPNDPNNQSGEGGQGNDDDHDHDGQGQPRTGQGWCGSCAGRPVPNEPDENKPGSGAEDNRTEQEMERMVRQVAEAVKSASAQRGKVPAGLQRWADEALRPPEIHWKTKLARITRTAIAWAAGATHHRYDGPSRRQAGLGFGEGKPVLPRLRHPIPKVAVIGDTSGSMGGSELAAVIRETNGILKAVGAEVTFAACDAAVHGGLVKVRSAKDLMSAMKGGGGTDMRPAFKAMERMRPRPEVVICITDGQVGDGFPTHAPKGMRVVSVLVGPHQVKPANWCECISIPHGKAFTEDEDF